MTQHCWLNAIDAAYYLSISTSQFLRQVKAGTLPPASTALGRRAGRWCTEDLDKLMRGDDAKSEERPSMEELVQAYVSKIAPLRKRRRRKEE